jgi:hypothetical protein
MSLLDHLDKIPDRIFPRLEARSYPLYIFWREVCHFVISCVLIIISHVLFLCVSVYAPIIIFILLGAWMTYQEFWLHPKKYDQKFWHGMMDWSVWMIPFIMYIIILYKF